MINNITAINTSVIKPTVSQPIDDEDEQFHKVDEKGEDCGDDDMEDNEAEGAGDHEAEVVIDDDDDDINKNEGGVDEFIQYFFDTTDQDRRQH